MIEIRGASEKLLERLDKADGLFIIPLCKNDESYIAVNNLEGRRWIEKFQSKVAAIYWLRGHWCLNIKNELCDGSTGEKILDIAERVRRGDPWPME